MHGRTLLRCWDRLRKMKTLVFLALLISTKAENSNESTQKYIKTFLKTKVGVESSLVNYPIDGSNPIHNGDHNQGDAGEEPSEEIYTIPLQSCGQFDSCYGRCITGSEARTDQTHFNCFCDENCGIFKDCCWDYYDACKAGGPTIDLTSVDTTPSIDAFECLTVDNYSKGSFWMITRCPSTWPEDDAIAKKCTAQDFTDFTTWLPVQDDRGWTYKNVYCAQCNYAVRFVYWSMKAQCTQSAPAELLSGNPDVFTYYIMQYCNLKLDHEIGSATLNGNNATSDIPEFNQEIFPKKSGWSETDVSWNKRLRRCEKNVIGECPSQYEDKKVVELCESYQSLLIYARSTTGASQYLIFKNSVCAHCYGVTADNHMAKDNSHENGAIDERMLGLFHAKFGNHSDLQCPVWLKKMYYDSPFWSIHVQEEVDQMNPLFDDATATKSSWVPPSFSILLNFHDDGSCEIEYTDEENGSSYNIPPEESCYEGEIYDPFYGYCRSVVCSEGEEYTDSNCVEAYNEGVEENENATTTSEASLSVILTVTIEVMKPECGKACVDFNDIESKINSSFVYSQPNTTVTNVTILRSPIETSFPHHDRLPENEDDSLVIKCTIIWYEPGEVDDNDIVRFAGDLQQVVDYKKLLAEVYPLDMLVVVLVEGQEKKTPLSCRDGTGEELFYKDEYSMIYYSGRAILYVNASDEYYLEDEYQLLDLYITISDEGVQRSYSENSRALVCVEVIPPPTVPPCEMYVPLNESEYVVLENGSLYLEERDMVIPPEDYIEFEDTVAVCIDDYIDEYNHNTTTTTETNYEEIEAVYLYFAWISFGLSVLSMILLIITFITYVLFSELRTIAGINIMNLTVAHFLSLFIFMGGATLTKRDALCTSITISLHYLFLATFFWANVTAFDVWHTFGKGIRNAFKRSLLSRSSVSGRSSYVVRKSMHYMIYGWGAPAIIIAICCVLEFATEVDMGYVYDPSYGFCWISNPTANLIAFGAPALLLLLSNYVMFGLAISAIRKGTFSSKSFKNDGEENGRRSNRRCRTQSEIAEERRRIATLTQNRSATRRRHSSTGYTVSRMAARSNIVIYAKMSTLMGFTWTFGFVAAFTQINAMWFTFEVFMPLQGAFMFLAFICQKRIYKLYKSFFGKFKIFSKEKRTCQSECSNEVFSDEIPPPTPHTRTGLPMA